MVVAHHGIVAGFVYSENCHTKILLSMKWKKRQDCYISTLLLCIIFSVRASCGYAGVHNRYAENAPGNKANYCGYHCHFLRLYFQAAHMPYRFFRYSNVSADKTGCGCPVNMCPARSCRSGIAVLIFSCSFMKILSHKICHKKKGIAVKAIPFIAQYHNSCILLVLQNSVNYGLLSYL